MAELLPCVEVEAQTPEVQGTVLWLHGLGADGHDFAPIVPQLRLPELRFVFPHAPRRPVTINAGMVMPAWYDVRDLGGKNLDREGIAASRAQIEALLRREEARGVPPERIVLAGFSQGGAMALHTGIRHPSRLCGLVVLSAYEPLPDRRQAEAADANRGIPILFCHGTADPLVPVDLGRSAARAYEAAGHAVEWHDYPIGHEVCLPEIEVIGSWLRRQLIGA